MGWRLFPDRTQCSVWLSPSWSSDMCIACHSSHPRTLREKSWRLECEKWSFYTLPPNWKGFDQRIIQENVFPKVILDLVLDFVLEFRHFFPRDSRRSTMGFFGPKDPSELGLFFVKFGLSLTTEESKEFTSSRKILGYCQEHIKRKKRST
jgi:hypothetical protein